MTTENVPSTPANRRGKGTLPSSPLYLRCRYSDRFKLALQCPGAPRKPDSRFPKYSSSKVTKAKCSSNALPVPTSSLSAGVAALQINNTRGHHVGYLRYFETKEAKARWIARKREEENLKFKQESISFETTATKSHNVRCMLIRRKYPRLRKMGTRKGFPLVGHKFVGFAFRV